MERSGDSWHIGLGRTLAVDQPRVIAILNVTPDSFSDGGELPTTEAAVYAARRAAGAGASLLDIGGESTRPGAARVPAREQIARILPAITAIRAAGGHLAAIPISIDTTLEPVARAALDAGADIVNDVSGASEDPRVLHLVAERRAGIILMHRERPPELDLYSTQYARGTSHAPFDGDIVARVRDALARMLSRAIDAGIDPQAVILDPGLGFGKSVAENLELIRRTPELLELGRPVLSGISRKSFVAAVSAHASAGRKDTPRQPANEGPGDGTGSDASGHAPAPLPPKSRLPGTLALSVEHLRAGARLFRVHDVAEHVMALNAAWACWREQAATPPKGHSPE